MLYRCSGIEYILRIILPFSLYFLCVYSLWMLYRCSGIEYILRIILPFSLYFYACIRFMYECLQVPLLDMTFIFLAPSLVTYRFKISVYWHPFRSDVALSNFQFQHWEFHFLVWFEFAFIYCQSCGTCLKLWNIFKQGSDYPQHPWNSCSHKINPCNFRMIQCVLHRVYILVLPVVPAAVEASAA
jgi:hypothetical protein